LFVRDGTLFAQAFDDRALQTSGDPARIGDHVGYWTAGLGYAAVTVSPAGLLAHGPSVGLTTSLRWHERSGASTGAAPTAPAEDTTGAMYLRPNKTERDALLHGRSTN